MHSSGWLLVAMCAAIGVFSFGLSLGFALGALLLASLLLHEVGHMTMATLLGVPVKEFGICLAGAYNRRAYARRRRDECLISISGPMMNLFLVVPLLFVPRIGSQAALCNLALFLFNLLPIPSSDGLRIVRNIWRSGESERMVPALDASGPR
jgi:Zn-dependent protease